MRNEASEAEGSSSFQSPAGTGAFANPLVDTPIVQDSHAMPRFDYYTDPMATYSGNKRQNNFSRSSRDNPISHGDSSGSAGCGNSMMQLPTPPPLGVSNCYVFKSRLQEYAQKVGFSTPFYDTIKEGPSHEPFFRSTVIVNNTRYESLPGFSNRKAAEQSAAEVALTELAKCRDTKDCMFQPVHELGLCKNLLQEYAQKMNYAMPTYECKREDTAGRGGHFSCTVEIGGIRYIGAVARTKKEAEIKAARTALLAIQTSSSEMGENPYEETKYTVVPSKRKEPAPKQDAIKTRKPKKGRLKKKFLNKRHKVGVDNAMRAENGGAEKGGAMNNNVGTETPVVPSGNGSLDGTPNMNQSHGDTSASERLLIPNLEISDCQPIGIIQKDDVVNLPSDEGRSNISDSKQCEGSGGPGDYSTLASNVCSLESNNHICVEQEGLLMKAYATSTPNQIVSIQNEPATPALIMDNKEENTLETSENLNQ